MQKAPLSKCISNLLFPQDGFSLLHCKSKTSDSMWGAYMHYSIGMTAGEFHLYFYGSEIPKVKIKFTLWTKDI